MAVVHNISGEPFARGFGANLRDSIEIKVGRLLAQKVDAALIPTNTDLLLNTDLAHEASRKAGPQLQRECNRIGKVTPGEAVLLKGGDLKKQRFVILAACFGYDEVISQEAVMLGTRNALLRTREYNEGCKSATEQIRSISLPPIDVTGERFPINRCAELMISEILRHTEKGSLLDRVLLIMNSKLTANIFAECLKQT